MGANVVLRGLRAVADFEYELQMANMNRKINCEVETLFVMTAEEYFFVSSRNVKEVVLMGRRREKLEEIAAEIAEDGGEADLEPCNIRSEATVVPCVRA